jgi:phage terminase large subunit
MIQFPEKWFNNYYKFLLTEPYRSCPLQILWGGGRSGKSVFLAQRDVLDVINEERNFLLVRNTGNTLRDSCFNEIVKAINQFYYAPYFKIVESPQLEITYKPRGNKFFFRGLDDTEKIKSITVPVGTITDLRIEEATEITENDLEMLELKLGGICTVPKRRVMSFNPIFKNHWIAKRYFNQQLIKYKFIRDQMLILHSVHWNNQFLTEQDHKSIEARTGYFHDVYTEGKWGVLGGVIFTNVEIRDLTDIRNTFDVYRHGLDFGFSADPSAYLRCGYKRAQKEIYILDEEYGHGWTNPVIAEKIKAHVGEAVVRCDSAEPKSIAEICEHGINAEPVSKGKDSVLHGIQWLQQHKLIIDAHCQNTINEIATFQWEKNKDGKDLPKPIGYNDHTIAALRYAFEEDMSFEDQPDVYFR